MIPLKYNLRSLRARWVTSLMTIGGAALVVWASVLAFGLVEGLGHTLEVSGDPMGVIVLRKGSTAETSSAIDEAMARQMVTLDGIATDSDGRPLASPELVVVVNAPRRNDGGKANLILRGVTPAAKAMRPEFEIVEGVDARPGVREVIASRAIANRFEGAGLGETLHVLDGDFEVVGLFEAGEGATESEVWTDLKVLAQASNREGAVSSVLVRGTNPASLRELQNRLTNDEQFGLEAISQQKYFSDQANAAAALKIVGYTIATVLLVGAMFAVANTMYGAVATRAREIGTLRALGFSRTNVLISFLAESLVLSLLGGLLGCLATLPLNGLQTGTANWVTFSELTFSFRFTPRVLAQGAALAALMGVVGGLLPAIRAVRMKIVNALREA